MGSLASPLARPSPPLEPYLKPATPRALGNGRAAQQFHFGFDGAEEFGVAGAEDRGEFGDACGGADAGKRQRVTVKERPAALMSPQTMSALTNLSPRSRAKLSRSSGARRSRSCRRSGPI